jgi:hypothetical protein
MGTTPTNNYGLLKPNPFEEDDTWGSILNDNFDKIDTQMKANANEAAAVAAALPGKQPLDADLTAIAAIAGTSGLLKKTAANTWTLDTTSYSPVGHTHTASQITDFSAAFNANLPARLGANAVTVTDWNNALENGWYFCSTGTNAPVGDWCVGRVEAINSANVTQTVHAYAIDGSGNTYTYRRSRTNNVWEAWYKLQLSQAEQDARYLLPERLGAKALYSTNFNLMVDNGWYSGWDAANRPDAGIQAWLCFVESAEAGYATQTAHGYGVDGSGNTVAYRRSLNANVWSAWYKLQLSQEEQDNRYARLSVQNTFTATQTISTANYAGFNISGGDGAAKRINFQTSGDTLWSIDANNIPETGSATGANFEINRYNNVGAWLETSFGIERVNGYVKMPGVYSQTTASAANVTVGAAGALMRSTSSIKYKKDVERLDHALVDNAIQNLRPIWYRSINPNGDDKAEWSHVGLIAEEVAQIEPRLVSYRTEEVSYKDGEQLVTKLAIPEPEGVDYARLSVLLLDVVQRQAKAIASLEARVAALESA